MGRMSETARARRLRLAGERVRWARNEIKAAKAHTKRGTALELAYALESIGCAMVHVIRGHEDLGMARALQETETDDGCN